MQKEKNHNNFATLGQDLIEFKKDEVALISVMFISELAFLLKKCSSKDKIQMFFKYRIIKK